MAGSCSFREPHSLAARCQEGFSVAERRIDQQRIEGYLSTLDEAMAHLQR